jgi:hypothetical protein
MAQNEGFATAQAPKGLGLTAVLKVGSPGITWGVFIGWFERGGKKTELLE